MARRSSMALAGAVAVLLHTPALAQDPAETGAEQRKPSFFKSLWSGIRKAAGKSAPGNSAPAEDASGEQAGAAATPPAAAPSLSSARWIGFTPALVVGEGAAEGAWVAGPFVEAGATGWVTDTLSGLTAQVRLVWRDAAPGGLAQLSAEAGRALGLAPGAVANVAVYLAPD